MAISTSLNPVGRVDKLLVYFTGQLVAVTVAVLVLLLNHSTNLRVEIEVLIYFMMGIPFAQVSLFAAWNALGTSERLLRPFGSILCLLYIWLISFVLPYNLDSSGPRVGPAFPAVAMLAQWVVVQVPLWFLRLTWDIRIQDAGRQKNQVEGQKSLQFSIMYLILWTTVVGVLLGVARMLVSNYSVTHHDSIEFGLFLLCNAAFAWPTVLGPLCVRYALTAWLGALLAAIAVTRFEPQLFAMVLGGRGTHSNVFWWLNGVQFLWLVLSMWLLRWMGFRLVRVRGAGPRPQGALAGQTYRRRPTGFSIGRENQVTVKQRP